MTQINKATLSLLLIYLATLLEIGNTMWLSSRESVSWDNDLVALLLARMVMLQRRAREMIHTNVGAAFDSNSFDGRTLDMKVEISNEFKSRLLT